MSLLAIMLAIPASAGILDLDAPMDYLKDKVKEGKVGVCVDFNGKAGAFAYLPVYTLHNNKEGDDRREYVDFGIGIARMENPDDALASDWVDQGENRVSITIGINLIGISNKLWKMAWANHVTITELPPIWFGPYITTPSITDLKETWVIGTRSGVQAVYQFGGK